MKNTVKTILKLTALMLAVLVSLIMEPTSSRAEAATYYVTDETALTAAVSSAVAGDTIVLASDIHITSTLKLDKALTFTTDGVKDRVIYVDFTGEGAETAYDKWAVYLSTAHVTFTGSASSRLIIDGQSQNRARGLLYVATKAGATVSYVTLRNCTNTTSGDNGCGGMYVSNGTAAFGDTVIDHCIVENCTSKYGNGGGLTVNSKNIWIKNCTFRGNTAGGNGGGIYQPAKTAETSYTGCVIESCVLDGNTAAAGSDAYIGISLTVFRNSFIKSAEGDNTVAGTQSTNTYGCYFVTEGADTLLSALPSYTAGIFITYADGDEAAEEAVYMADADSYEDYLTLVETTLGVTLSRVTLDGVSRADCTYGSSRYYFYYTEYDGCLRIIAEPSSYTDLGTYSHGTGTVKPTVTMINVADETNSTTTEKTRYGLCLIYQLSDGSFIIVDGGYEDSYYEGQSASQRIYDKLVSLHGSASGINIAAWIISHSHNDHAGAICSFAANYSGSVTLERLMYNLPSDLEYSGNKAAYGDEDTTTAYKTRIKALAWADRIVKLHAGDRIQISDAAIDVLYTAEMLKPVKLANINETSVVTRIALGDYKSVVLADASQLTEKFLVNAYSTELEADIVTTAHHGYYGRSVTGSIYEAIAPDMVLWPASNTVYSLEANQATDANQWLFDHVDYRHIYLAADYESADDWGVTLSLLKSDNPALPDAEPVARIGSRTCLSIYEAVVRARAGETIELLKNIYLTEPLKINKSVSLTLAAEATESVTITYGDTGDFPIRVDGPTGKTITVSISGLDDERRLIIDGQGAAYGYPALLVQRATGSDISYVTIINHNSSYGTGGGAAYNTQGTGVTFNNCIFSGCSNTGKNGGGAFYQTTTGASAFNSCRFEGNSVTANGAAILVRGSISLEDCRFSGNTGSGDVYELAAAEGDTRSIQSCYFDKQEAAAVIRNSSGVITPAVLSLSNYFLPAAYDSSAETSVYVQAKVGNTITVVFYAYINADDEALYDDFIFRARLGEGSYRSLSAEKIAAGIYAFSFTEIYSQCMNDKITGKIQGVDGDGYTTTLKEITTGISVAEYCNALAADEDVNTNTDLMRFLANMLYFGTACQNYSGYRTSDLAITGSTSWANDYIGSDIPVSPVAKEDISVLESGATVRISSASLLIRNKISIRFRVYAPDTTGCTLQVDDRIYDLEDYEADSSITYIGGYMYQIELDRINPSEYDHVYVARLYAGDTLQHTVKYSVNTYCSNKYTANVIADFVKAIYNYGVAAAAYKAE